MRLKISHKSLIFSIGSCFALNIQTRLNNLLFETSSNPSGITFNPISIAKTLNFICDRKQFTASELFFDEGLFHSLEHHSNFSGVEAPLVISKINSELEIAYQKLESAHVLIITLGTAQVFELQSSGEVVNNCHKLPAHLFSKKMLSVDEIEKNLEIAIRKLRILNPTVEIIFTISPVRHTKMGLNENNLSKAKLIVAAHNICNALHNVHYFPAYEIMMDDLRDYRFYNADLIHPTEQAVDYIFEIFQKTYFSELTQQIVNEIQKIKNRQAHRPIHRTEQTQNFLLEIEAKIALFKKNYPDIHWH